MNTTIHRALVMELQAGVTHRFPVLTHLSYDPADPFAVTLAFAHEGRVLARWRLDREMLADGLTRPVGAGDVRLRPEPKEAERELRMEFLGQTHTDGSRHHAVVFAWAGAIGDFLCDTFHSVPPGGEDLRLDDFLTEILTGH